MLHNPSIVFLDEPTIGMDVVVKQKVREFLRRQVVEHGSTIILTTHDMTEVSRLCERIVLVNDGRIIYDGNLERIRSDFRRRKQVRVVFGEPIESLPLRDVEVDFDGRREATLTLAYGVDYQSLIRHMVIHYPVESIRAEEADLEDVIRDVYDRSALEAQA
jgi:ABC-2 type transport system ATP-binding protein